MMLLPCDIVLIVKAARLNVTIDDVKVWLGADALELLEEKTAQSWAEPTGCVYFVQHAEAVKIGFTSHLPSRLAKLKTSMPEEPRVLLTIDGAPPLETHFHNKFAKDRMVREWFRLSGDISEFVARRQWNEAAR